MDWHELVSLGTLAVVLLGVVVQFVRAFWERRARDAAEQRHREELQLRRDGQERDLLISMHGSLEQLRLRALAVLRESPAPRAYEDELVGAIREARFKAGQLAAPNVREPAMQAVTAGTRVRDRKKFDETVDTNQQPDDLTAANGELQKLVENATDKAVEAIERRLRELDPSPARGADSKGLTV
jgi:hypothetical protein